MAQTMTMTLRRLVPPQVRPAVRAVTALPIRSRLDALARLHGTDKSTITHGYTTYYSDHLGPRRRTVRSVLEIGVGGVSSWHGYDTPHGGQSLRMWRDYFPRAQILGIDIEAKNIAGRRLHFRQGSQDDAGFLRSIGAEFGPFDLIVDDGSHVGRHIRTSFDVLFAEHLQPGGIYVIEDLETAYRDDFDGGPPGRADTAVSLLRELLDDVLRRHWESRHGGVGRPVEAIHLYDQIAFVYRS